MMDHDLLMLLASIDALSEMQREMATIIDQQRTRLRQHEDRIATLERRLAERTDYFGLACALTQSAARATEPPSNGDPRASR